MIILPIIQCDYAIRSFTPINDKSISLTFDDGPHGVLTDKLLNILHIRKAYVTFFILGIKVTLHPRILKRIIIEGHEIGNHGWNHPVMSKLSHVEVHQQLQSTANAIYNITAYLPTIMRPPYGNTNKNLNRYITTKEGLDVILWSLDTLDWKRPPATDIVQRVIQYVKPGDIILFHDIHPGTVDAIALLLDLLQPKGYMFRTVSQMKQLVSNITSV